MGEKDHGSIGNLGVVGVGPEVVGEGELHGGAEVAELLVLAVSLEVKDGVQVLIQNNVEVEEARHRGAELRR